MNFGTPVPLLIGIVLIIGAVALFFLDKLKPGYERDSDKVYAVLGLISGVFLLGHLTMELIPSFQQMLMAGMLVALMIENIRSRSPNERQSRPVSGGGTPYRGDDYRPNRAYRENYSYEENIRPQVRVELDEELISPMEDVSRLRRIRAARSGRSSTRDAYDQDAYLDQMEEDSRPPRRSSRSSSCPPVEAEDRAADYGYGEADRTRRRRTAREETEASDSRFRDGGDSQDPVAEVSASIRRRRNATATEASFTPTVEPEVPASIRNRRRSRTDRISSSSGGDRAVMDGDYVDYKPLDLPSHPRPSQSNGEETDNSNNFDD